MLEFVFMYLNIFMYPRTTLVNKLNDQSKLETGEKRTLPLGVFMPPLLESGEVEFHT